MRFVVRSYRLCQYANNEPQVTDAAALMGVFTYDTDICPGYANGMAPSCPGEVDSGAAAY